MKKLILTLMIAAIPVYGFAFEKTIENTIEKNVEKPTEKATKEHLKKSDVAKLIGAKVNSLSPSPVPGILEVIVDGNQVIYIDETGRYLFVGNLFDVVKGVNLRQTKEDELNVVNFADLPLEETIVQGDGPVKIAIFDDPDCPYCRKLHKELKKLKNVRIHYFIFNLPMHPGAYDKSKKILCAKDRLGALDRAMNGDPLDDLKICETDQVDKNKELSEKLGIRGTPHIIIESGQSIRGGKSAEELQKIVDSILEAKKKLDTDTTK